jgi:hypothetical protein
MSNSPKTTVVKIFHILVMTFVGVLIGVITSIVSHLIYLVFLFPIIIGFLGAMSIHSTVNKAKIWKTSQGIFLGVVMALVIYGAYHYSNYLAFRLQMIVLMNAEISEAAGEPSAEVANIFTDYALKEETGHSGFIGYMMYKASRGLSIGKMFRASTVNIGPVLTWLYWLAEIVAVAWITSRAGKIASSEPFCEHCNAWFGKEKHIGGVSLQNSAQVVQLCDKRDFSELGKILQKDVELPSLEVYMRSCETCQTSDAFLDLSRISFGQNGNIQHQSISKMLICPSNKLTLMQELRFQI